MKVIDSRAYYVTKYQGVPPPETPGLLGQYFLSLRKYYRVICTLILGDPPPNPHVYVTYN